MKKKIRIVLIVCAVVLIIAELTIIDYSNLTWSKNFPVIIAMILVIISSIMAIRYDKK